MAQEQAIGQREDPYVYLVILLKVFFHENHILMGEVTENVDLLEDVIPADQYIDLDADVDNHVLDLVTINFAKVALFQVQRSVQTNSMEHLSCPAFNVNSPFKSIEKPSSN